MTEKGPVTSSVTSHKVKNDKNKVGRHDNSVWQQSLMCLSSNCAIYVAKWAVLWAYDGQGHVTDLTSDGLYEKFDIYKMWVPGGLLIFGSFIFLRKIACHWQRYKVATFCDRAEFTYDFISKWPDFTWKWKKLIMSGLNGELLILGFMSLSQTVLEQLRENCMGVAPTPPSPSAAARVNPQA